MKHHLNERILPFKYPSNKGAFLSGYKTNGTWGNTLKIMNFDRLECEQVLKQEWDFY